MRPMPFWPSFDPWARLTPPQVPPRIARIKDIAYNLWWSWNPPARGLFKYIDRTLWRNTNHNPVKLLVDCRPGRLDAVAKDPSFLQRYDAAVGDFDPTPSRRRWRI